MKVQLPVREWIVDSPGLHCAFVVLVAAIVISPTIGINASLIPGYGADPFDAFFTLGGLIYSVWWLEFVEMSGPLLVIRASLGSTMSLPKWAQGPRRKWAVGLVGWGLAIGALVIAIVARNG